MTDVTDLFPNGTGNSARRILKREKINKCQINPFLAVRSNESKSLSVLTEIEDGSESKHMETFPDLLDQENPYPIFLNSVKFVTLTFI